MVGNPVDLRPVLRPHPSVGLQAPPHGRVGRGPAGRRHGGLHGAPGQVRGDSRHQGGGAARGRGPTFIRDSRIIGWAERENCIVYFSVCLFYFNAEEMIIDIIFHISFPLRDNYKVEIVEAPDDPDFYHLYFNH